MCRNPGGFSDIHKIDEAKAERGRRSLELAGPDEDSRRVEGKNVDHSMNRVVRTLYKPGPNSRSGVTVTRDGEGFGERDDIVALVPEDIGLGLELSVDIAEVANCGLCE